MFCGYGASSMNMLYRDFGCDAVLCRPGTFNNHGHATLHSSCRPCPSTDEGELEDPPVSKILGRTTCDDFQIVHGDLNGDGILSPREILRMIFVDTLGRFWGQSFQPWADVKVSECDLLGITCVNGKIARIDLTSAEMCSNGDRRPGPIAYCKGLPTEIGLFDGIGGLSNDTTTISSWLHSNRNRELVVAASARYFDLSLHVGHSSDRTRQVDELETLLGVTQ